MTKKNQTDANASLIIEPVGAVDWVTINRPKHRNALDVDLIERLVNYFESLAYSPEVKAVVLKGAGKGFCAGIDLQDKDPKGLSGALENPFVNLDLQMSARNIILAMRRCPQPIIGLINGYAVGAGFTLALACDVRIASSDMSMLASFVKIGLCGGDVGLSYFLPRMAGSALASELLLTGRPLLADRALQHGIVSQVVDAKDLVTEGQKISEEIASGDAFALWMTKDVLNINTDANSLEAALALEDRTQVLCGQSEHFRKSVRAFTSAKA